jgi:hypothetical protein
MRRRAVLCQRDPRNAPQAAAGESNMSPPDQIASIKRITELLAQFDQGKSVNYYELTSRSYSLIHDIAPKSRYTDLAAAALDEPGDPTNSQWVVEKQKAIRFQGILRALKDDLERGKVFSPESDVPAFRLVERLLLKFPTIVKQLRKRHGGRTTFPLDDEYDVQDLLHGLLFVDFDDIRDEEWTPSYAGGSTRMDFLLKRPKIVIEVKLAKAKHADREIADELLVDIPHYKEHPDCNTLVCFIFDPEQQIKNPAGLKFDLERNSDEDFTVAIFIVPH